MKATVEIEVGAIEKYSFLKKLFAQPPLKVMDITEAKRNNPLHLMLMSSSPGIMDGDQYGIRIDLKANAALQLHTQSYQRLFQMKSSASQTLTVRMQDGAAFCYLPHPTVPHHLSDFTTTNDFYLGDNCRLLYGEVLTCGRKLNGEAFAFSKYHSVTNIFINGRLVVKENLLLIPHSIDVNAIGQLEGFTHQASLLFLQQGINIPGVAESLAKILESEKNMEFGISALAVDGMIVRMLGQGAEQLYSCLQRINSILPHHFVNSIEHAT